LLRWAEKKGKTQISRAEVDELSLELCLDLDPSVVSAHIWTFLSLCCKGDAEVIFNSGEQDNVRNGLETWRKLYDHISSGISLRYLVLRDQVNIPLTAKKAEDVPMVLADWEGKLREYVDVGGTAMGDYEKKMTMIKILPQSMRDNLLWRAMEQGTSYQLFRETVCSRVAETQYLSHQQQSQPRGAYNVTEQVSGEGMDEEAMAMELKKRGFQVSRTSNLGGDRGGGGFANRRPTVAGDVSCINCGSKSHATRDCTAPKVDPSKRPCFKCGKPGHLARDCRSTGAPAHAAVEEDEVAMCVAEDWQVPKSAVRTIRSKATLGDFCLNIHNRLAALDQDHDTANVDEMNDDKELVHSAPPIHEAGVKLKDKAKRRAARRQNLCDFKLCDLSNSNSVGCIDACCVRSSDALSPTSWCRLCGWRGKADRECGGCGALHTLTPIKVNFDLAADFYNADHERNVIDEWEHFKDDQVMNEAGIFKKDFEDNNTKHKVDAMVMEEEEFNDDALNLEGEWEEITLSVTADSGAGNHIVDADDIPGYSIEESAASRAGKGFVAANKQVIANEGQAMLNLMAGDRKMKSTFQVAKVSRALMSIGKICDQGHKVIFDKNEGKVLDSNGKMICKFVRRGGLYVMDVKLMAPPGHRAGVKKAGFARPGARR